MIALLVNFRVDPDKRDAFEAAIGDLAAATLTNEPEVRIYQLCRSQAEEGVYRLFELYASQEALDRHMQTEWFLAARPRIGPLVAEPPGLERLGPLG
jgi:quinol monooxygenase YgiN